MTNSTWNLEPQTWNPRRRRAVTIIEVLFSILITSVGLLGAIALFPVASAQANKAKQNDAVAACGREAFHMFDMMGMRRPTDRWYAWDAANSRYGVVSWSQGESYCIDSRFIVRNKANMGSGTTQAQFFPYTSPANAPATQMNRIAFFPGTINQTNPGTNQFDWANGTTGTDISGGPAYGRNLLLADSIFQFEDDLTFIRPGLDDVSQLAPGLGLTGITNDRSIPAFQIFTSLQNGGSTIPGPRPTLGHISWMATIVPKIDLYAGQGSDQYVLSIVVFYDRPTDLFLSTGATGNQNILERTVTAVAQDDGSTGGEFLLSVPDATFTAPQAEERLKVRANDWILLSGRQTYNKPGGGANTANRFQWYRVTHCDADIDHNTTAAPNAYSRYVTLMGQDWDATGLTNQQATLITGVAAVYEKTIRLDYGSTF